MEYNISTAELEKHISSGALCEPLPNMRASAYESLDFLAGKIEEYGLTFLLEKDAKIQLNYTKQGPVLMLSEPTPTVAHLAVIEQAGIIMEKIREFGLQAMIEGGFLDINIGLKDNPVFPLINLSQKKVNIR